jgi:hypothetical protein
MIDPSKDNVFSWQQDGTQTAFYIEYCLTSSGAPVYNTGWQVYSTAQFTFVATTFTVNCEYKWHVKIRNSVGVEGIFSDYSVFRSGYMTPLTVTSPTPDMVSLSTLPVYTFAYTSSEAQAGFEAQVYTAALWNTTDALTATQQEACTWDQLELYGGTEVWDSGEIAGLGNSVSQPSGYLLPSVYWYKARITVTDDLSDQYISDLRTFYILLSNIPATPTITAASDPINGQNVITITNPTPSGGQVTEAYNRLYRRQPDGTWLLVQDNITTNHGYDKTCKSGIQEEYACSAVGTNGVEGGFSTSAFATCTLTAWWFTDSVSNLTAKVYVDPQWGKMASTRGRKEFWGEDSQYPTVIYDQSRYYKGSFKGALLYTDAAGSWTAYIANIGAVLDADTKNPIIMRTPYGDRYEVDVFNFAIDPDDPWGNYRHISFDFEETIEFVPPSTYTYNTPPSPITNYWVTDPTTGKGIGITIGNKWASLKSERDRNSLIGYSQLMPSVNYGNKKVYRGSFSGYLVYDGVTALADQVKMLRELVDNKTKAPLLFLTFSGDQFLCDVYNFTFSIFDIRNNARQISFELVEVSSSIWQQAVAFTWGQLEPLTWQQVKGG